MRPTLQAAADRMRGDVFRMYQLGRQLHVRGWPAAEGGGAAPAPLPVCVAHCPLLPAVSAWRLKRPAPLPHWSQLEQQEAEQLREELAQERQFGNREQQFGDRVVALLTREQRRVLETEGWLEAEAGELGEAEAAAMAPGSPAVRGWR